MSSLGLYVSDIFLLFFFFNCQVYRNPFNYGKLNNWKVFLGVEKRRCVSLMFVMIFLLRCIIHNKSCLVLLVTCSVLSFVSSHWLTRVILPSGHAPPGDGLTWDTFPVKKDLVPVWQTLLRHTCSPISAVFAVSNPLWSFDLVGCKDPCMMAPYSGKKRDHVNLQYLKNLQWHC